VIIFFVIAVISPTAFGFFTHAFYIFLASMCSYILVKPINAIQKKYSQSDKELDKKISMVAQLCLFYIIFGILYFVFGKAFGKLVIPTKYT
jgi:predicted PurR-regulated permease PerM